MYDTFSQKMFKLQKNLIGRKLFSDIINMITKSKITVQNDSKVPDLLEVFQRTDDEYEQIFCLWFV